MKQISQMVAHMATQTQAANFQQQKKMKQDFASSTATIQWKEMDLPVVDFIHQAMLDTYNNLWKHTELPLSWTLVIGDLSIDQIKRGVWRCMKEEEFPPSPAKFLKLATGSDFDYEASFDRFINRKPLSDVEWFASQKVGFSCRTQLSDAAARKEWKRAIDIYLKEQIAGNLPPRGQAVLENLNKGNDCEWLAPDGNKYKCPAEYWASKLGNK